MALNRFSQFQEEEEEQINPELPGSGVVFLCNHKGTLLSAQSVPMTAPSIGFFRSSSNVRFELLTNPLEAEQGRFSLARTPLQED